MLHLMHTFVRLEIEKIVGKITMGIFKLYRNITSKDGVEYIQNIGGEIINHLN